MSNRSSEDAFSGDELLLAVEIAERYYLRHQSKLTIATELDVSRFRVARILQRSLDEGLVRISIAAPRERNTELADQLRARYDLEHVVLVDMQTLKQEQRLRELLGRAAAALIMRITTRNDVLGLGWGRSVAATAAAITTLPPCPIVQLGGIVGSLDTNSMEPLRMLSAVSHGDTYPLFAPLLLPDVDTANGLRRQPGIASTLEMFDKTTIGVVAVGSWTPPNSQLREAFNRGEQRRMSEQGVRAEVCGVLLDDRGNPLMHEVSARTIAIGSEQLQQIPTTIAVAGGLTKVNAIHSVLLGRYATSLVTDLAVARELLARA
ncbi:MAG: transcriptional regulator [Microbacteriaceae bacterium]|jgi:DNA-binding transcriptional regulator LsrR (DeoR family)|nr:transcriptional regulator [Microbacteriaceae bacterium]